MDELDISEEREYIARQDAIRAVRNVPFDIGVSGECEECEEWSARLVRGWCARCRDLYRRM